jgi:ABC-type antimicrobial peptide transport system permease subunit
VLSYGVVQRTPEIGLRMALGAPRASVIGAVLRNALKLAALGIVLGLAGTLGVTRLLASLLFGVTPLDPVTLAAVAALLVIVTLVASCVPAMRASRIDPLMALRSD